MAKSKYSDELKKMLFAEYTKSHLKISEISRKHKIPVKTLYRFKEQGKWDEYLKEQAKTMYLEERTKLPDIAKKLRKPLSEITNWKENGKWDNEIYIIGNIGLSRELNTEFIAEVRKALKEKKIAEPATVDKLTKLLKIIEKLNPQRIRLANIFQLLKDLTDFVMKYTDDDFSKKYQKYLPEMADWLRGKYADQ